MCNCVEGASWQRIQGGKHHGNTLMGLNLFSCHLFVCFPSSEGDEVGPGITDDTEDENSANQIAGKIPNFCVLLHGSLKVEGMVAVVQLGYGAGCLPEKSLLPCLLMLYSVENSPLLGKAVDF